MSHGGRTVIRASRFVGLGVAVALVAFHGWLLWDRVARGDFGWVEAVRWAAAFAVVAAIRELCRRTGGFQARQAVVLGLLVVALHVGVTPPAVDAASQDHGSTAVFLLPVAVAPTVALLLLGFTLAAANRSSSPGAGTRLDFASVRGSTRDVPVSLFSRPPPR